jgi:hypothetical protein
VEVAVAVAVAVEVGVAVEVVVVVGVAVGVEVAVAVAVAVEVGVAVEVVVVVGVAVGVEVAVTVAVAVEVGVGLGLGMPSSIDTYERLAMASLFSTAASSRPLSVKTPNSSPFEASPTINGPTTFCWKVPSPFPTNMIRPMFGLLPLVIPWVLLSAMARSRLPSLFRSPAAMLSGEN